MGVYSFRADGGMGGSDQLEISGDDSAPMQDGPSSGPVHHDGGDGFPVQEQQLGGFADLHARSVAKTGDAGNPGIQHGGAALGSHDHGVLDEFVAAKPVG